MRGGGYLCEAGWGAVKKALTLEGSSVHCKAWATRNQEKVPSEIHKPENKS